MCVVFKLQKRIEKLQQQKKTRENKMTIHALYAHIMSDGKKVQVCNNSRSRPLTRTRKYAVAKSIEVSAGFAFNVLKLPAFRVRSMNAYAYGSLSERISP